MRPAAARRIIRLKKLLEMDVPSAEFFFAGVGDEVSEELEVSVADEPTVVLAATADE